MGKKIIAIFFFCLGCSYFSLPVMPLLLKNTAYSIEDIDMDMEKESPGQEEDVKLEELYKKEFFYTDYINQRLSAIETKKTNDFHCHSSYCLTGYLQELFLPPESLTML